MTKTFEDLGLSEEMLKAVQKLKYANPTPVQEQAIPAALEGRDIIAGAQTGTGKTAAFCLPSMNNLPHCQKGCGPYMLVVTPTRELADQICEVCDKIAKVTKHKVAKFVGGVSYNPQRDALRRGIDVLIATPGRLEDLINQGAAHLDQVKILVLDEADRMVDMGFLPSITNIVDKIEGEHQTLLFSATIDRNVKRVSKDLMNDPVQIEIARRGETSDNVDQYVIRINHRAKQEALEAILNDRGARRVIVFARTKHRVDTCARNLKKAGFKVETIHSDRSQAQRRKALQFFDKGSANILVATDVLARGIDVSNVDYVVNFDMPMMAEDYVHRIGRTGRAGEKGFAVSLVSPETEGMLKDIQKLIKMKLPELEIEGFDRKEAEAHAKERADKSAREGNFDAKDKRESAGFDDRADNKKGRRKHDDERKPKKDRKKSKDADFKDKKSKHHHADDESKTLSQDEAKKAKKKHKGSKGNDQTPRPGSFEIFYKGKPGKRDKIEQGFDDERNNYDDEREFKPKSKHGKKASGFKSKRDGKGHKGNGAKKGYSRKDDGSKRNKHDDKRKDSFEKRSSSRKEDNGSYSQGKRGEKPRFAKDGKLAKKGYGKKGYGQKNYGDKDRNGSFKGGNGSSDTRGRKAGYKKKGNGAGKKSSFRPGRYSSNRS